MLTPSDVRSTTTKYVKSHDLMSSDNKRYVQRYEERRNMSKFIEQCLIIYDYSIKVYILNFVSFRVRRPVLL